ncbi:hypothetical protein [Nodosilinea nodulosa]|uniref:hypothetical protein n=1 Tax=Nodosilinea nodulosa TaxID=416001 RepID=UPI0002F67882|nr:hypothetical protein [Nodosilinea nodulosa]
MDSLFVLFLNRYFWLICLLVTWINAVIFKLRSRPYIRQNPALAPGYATLIRGFLVCSSLPWLMMGFGILVGDVPAIWYFLYPNTNDPYVLAWWVLYWLNIGTIAYWVILRGGAEMMISHPGFLRGSSPSLKTVKLFWLLMLGTTIVITIILFNQPLPTEPV